MSDTLLLEQNGRLPSLSLFKTLLACYVFSATFAYTTISSAVSFRDVAASGDANIDYRRTASVNNVLWDEVRQGSFTFQDLPNAPGNTRGAPGVALLDYDRDGDLDIYVSNGPGQPNSLYSSQLKESNTLYFVDVGVAAGVAATDQDSTGVCFGDIDNDGDPDLLVLGRNETNRLFENQGNGTFLDISVSSQIGVGVHSPSSCAMGDINNDGLLDIFIGNSYNNWSHRLPVMLFGFEHLIEDNQLYLNRGSNEFMDVSATSGVLTQKEITWAVSMVDYDLDGDIDILTADDQGGKLPAAFGGNDVGFIRVYNNNGNGQFTDVTASNGTMEYGAWMGLAFGDLNHDGYMDLFASNFGDYSGMFTGQATGIPYRVGDWSSIWFFGDASGKFSRTPPDAAFATPFGWGAAMTDYDNDGDTDIIFHGGADFAAYQDGSNPGALLNNDGTGKFTRDVLALAGSTDHARRNVKGVAVGDLNNDGFEDIVSVSGQDWPTLAPVVPLPSFPLGSPFDTGSVLWPAFIPSDPNNPSAGFIWSGIDALDGTLSIEINSADNGNQWVKVRTMGTQGVISRGAVNRDGIGAVIQFTPSGDKPIMTPVLGGSSYASQNSLEKSFGLGHSKFGTVDILWPGGIRNQLRYVKATEAILFPEIPCSYDDEKLGIYEYSRCVWQALSQLKAQGIIQRKQQYRFYVSAMLAYIDHH